MKRTITGFALAALLAAWPGGAQATGAADGTKALIDLMKQVKNVPEGAALSAEGKKANVATFAAMDGLFDMDAFANSCLGASASKFSAAQKAEFRKRLGDILRRRGYTNGGAAFREGVLKEGAVTAKGGREVQPLSLHFPKEDATLEVEFHWTGAKCVDLVIDGDSLVKDYQNQIGRIVAKDGVAGVLTRLAKNQKDLPAVLP